MALLAAGLSVAALPAQDGDREPRIRAVRANADASVSAAAPRANFGRDRTLRVDASPTERAYVAFDLSSSYGSLKHVSLLLFSRSGSRLGYRVQLVGQSWRERRITYENAPRPSPRFAVSGAIRARTWKAVDVTDMVGDIEDGAVSFALTTVSPREIVLASREAGMHGPRLVVETEDRGTTSTRTNAVPERPPRTG